MGLRGVVVPTLQLLNGWHPDGGRVAGIGPFPVDAPADVLPEREGVDADGWDALLEHCRETNCRSVCQGCDEGVGEHWAYNSSAFWQHVDDCNVCLECEQHFKSYYDLKQVSDFYCLSKALLIRSSPAQIP